MEKMFSLTPSVSITRSKFMRKSQHKTSFNLGEIVPIYFDEVLPGDTRSISLASLIRMSTPIAPIMDNIVVDYYAFSVPCRLVYDKWKKFMGENDETAGLIENEAAIPTLDLGWNNDADVELNRSLGAYLGLNPYDWEGVDGSSKGLVKVSALPFRGYYAIYNRWFRDQNLIDPIRVVTDESNKAALDFSDGDSVFGLPVLKAAKLSDYFTRALPYPQKGADVPILDGMAPVVGLVDSVGNPILHFSDRLGLGGDDLIEFGDSVLCTDTAGNICYDEVLASNAGTTVESNNWNVDLAKVAGNTIRQLRYNFQLQKFLEKDAMYGTRYWELLHAHFGVNAPDASLQEPEFLGHYRANINIDQVLQTTGYTADGDSELGQVGANSVTGSNGSLFTKSFTEHGYIYIMAVARHEQTYGQGINRMFTRFKRTDYYFPVFANIGAQEIKNKEILITPAIARAGKADEVFGYQEAWADYKYKPSIVSGVLAPSRPNGLDFWTLANDFGELPTLSKSFIEQGRENLSRALTTASTGPDFIADFYFEDVAVRPMPLYSVPGLADHH